MGEKDFGRSCEAVAFGENIAKGETGLRALLTCETPSSISSLGHQPNQVRGDHFLSS
jgi:hypothetical protein